MACYKFYLTYSKAGHVTQHVTGLKVYTILIEYILLIQAILHKDFPGMYGFFKSPLTLPPNIAVLPTKTSAKIEE